MQQTVRERTLEEFLEFNCEYLRQAVKAVAPGADLRPRLIYISRAGDVHFIYFQMRDKDGEIMAARRELHAAGARKYAMIMAGWSVLIKTPDPVERERLYKLVGRYGTGHPETRGLRKEVYIVTVGDLNRTIAAHFDVERDAMGKIVKLTRDMTFNQPHISTGRMVDLLAEPPPP